MNFSVLECQDIILLLGFWGILNSDFLNSYKEASYMKRTSPFDKNIFLKTYYPYYIKLKSNQADILRNLFHVFSLVSNR